MESIIKHCYNYCTTANLICLSLGDVHNEPLWTLKLITTPDKGGLFLEEKL